MSTHSFKGKEMCGGIVINALTARLKDSAGVKELKDHLIGLEVGPSRGRFPLEIIAYVPRGTSSELKDKLKRALYKGVFGMCPIRICSVDKEE